MLCPTCHSDIGTGSTDDADRQQGAQGVDANGRPVPFFSDDPLLTRREFSSGYQGTNRPRVAHIVELQELRNAQEDESGLPQTSFSPIDNTTHSLRRHIIELRIATERLIAEAGSTLEEYFKLDADGNEQAQNPRLAEFGVPNPQVEWVDVDRGAEYIDKDGNPQTTYTLPDSSVEQAPTIPARIKVRGIHIEDLRHQVPTGLATVLVSGGSAGSVDPNFTTLFYGEVFTGNKDGKANFKKVES